MGFVIGFAPWIVYWILVGNTGFVTAVAVAFGIALAGQVLQRARRQPSRTLEVGTVAVFALLLIAALLVDDAVLARWLQPLSNFGLFAIAAVGVLVGRPFVREYAVGSVDAATAAGGGFRYVTTAMTWMWVAAFGAMTLVSLIPPIVDGDATMRDDGDPLSIVCYWVLPYTLMGVAGLVSAMFPGWFDKTSHLLAEQSSMEPTVVSRPSPPEDRVEEPGPRRRRGFPPRSTLRGRRARRGAGCRAYCPDHRNGSLRLAVAFGGSVRGPCRRNRRRHLAGTGARRLGCGRQRRPAVGDAVRVGRSRTRTVRAPAGPWNVTVDVTSAQGRVRRTVIRRAAAPGVTVTEREVDGRPALLALPAGDAPTAGWPGVVCFGGSEGGVDSQRSNLEMLASHGWSALAYSWVDEPGTEPTLVDIPLERFATAVTFLRTLAQVDGDRVTAVGTSRSAEGLLAAACDGLLDVNGLVLTSPSSVSWQAIGPEGEIPDTPSWTRRGRAVPWAPLPGGTLMPQLIRNAWHAHRDIAAGRPSLLRLGTAYRAGLAAAPANSILHSERVAAPLLCLTGEDDELWPSADMATALLARRAERHDEHRCFPGAGHLVRWGMFPSGAQWTGGIALGGGGIGQARAQREAIQCVLGFLSRTAATTSA